MNKTRIKDAIRILQMPKSLLYMPEYQRTCMYYTTAKSLKQLHNDGTAACLAGFIAVSPMFIKAGGRSGYDGMPNFNTKTGGRAIADWFEIDEQLARALCATYTGGAQRLYGTLICDITKEMVIEKLEKILSGELT